MKTTVTDEQLTAYLDGELADEQRKAIDDALSGDGDLRARLDVLGLPRDALKAAFDDVLSGAPTMPALPEPAAANQNRPARLAPVALAAALLFGIFIGAGTHALVQPGHDSDWKMAVAHYQVLYVAETLTSVAPPAADDPVNLASLSEALGRDLTGARIADGLEFRRAQLLGLEGQPLVQIAYLSEANEPFAICVTPVSQGNSTPETETIEGLASAHWVRDGFGYLIIGGNDLGFVGKLADDLKARI